MYGAFVSTTQRRCNSIYERWAQASIRKPGESPGRFLLSSPATRHLPKVVASGWMSSLARSRDPAEAGDSITSRTPDQPGVEDDPSAPFLCMRLMCSQNQAEVEAVKKELLKTGIKSEMRNHPMAEALGVTGIELWIQDEQDFFNAANVFARMQATQPNHAESAAANPAAVAPQDQRAPVEKKPQNTKPQPPAVESGEIMQVPELKAEELEQTSSLLQEEIEEMLKWENELAADRTSLRRKIKELNQALTDNEAAFAREAETRAATERTLTQQLSGLQSALEGERAQREIAEQQLERERIEHDRIAQQMSQDRDHLQEQLQSRDTALQESQKKLEGKAQLLRSQEAAVLKLRKEMASLDVERNESRKALAKAGADLAQEREARVAAEHRAETAEALQKFLENQLLEQKHLLQKLQAHWANLNSLYSKVHANRASRATN